MEEHEIKQAPDEATASTPFGEAVWVARLAFAAAPWVIAIVGACTVAAGVLPAAVASLGRLIVDGVVRALADPQGGWEAHRGALGLLVALEGACVTLLLAATRAQNAALSILRVRLANEVTEQILDKALALRMEDHEDHEIHDRLMRARRDAGVRPFNLVTGAFTVARNAVTFASCIGLLAGLSPLAVVLVIAAGLPAFLSELRFSLHAFDHHRKRSPEQREQAYLEAVLSREDFAKEVRFYDLGARLLDRFRAIALRAENEERALSVRRNAYGFLLSLLGTAVFYGASLWIVGKTVNEHLSLGEMTMYIAVFRQAQQGVTAGLASLGQALDDRLYLRDLRSFLALDVETPSGTATRGPDPAAGLEVRGVTFRYPGASRPALDKVSFTLPPGQMLAIVGHNGSGKTTLMKLFTRLYDPGEGQILLDGLDVRAWAPRALRRRFALVFQDFVRFKWTAGENIGAGDVEHWDDEARWERAARRGLAHGFVTELPKGYHAPLGKWFRGGTELSGGQWQKLALSRAFMREQDTVVVLDEPTAALDPEAERGILEHVQAIRGTQAVLLVSHRFGSVRIADRILVLDHGRVVEDGTHDALMALRGLYANLFEAQASGYLDRRNTGTRT